MSIASRLSLLTRHSCRSGGSNAARAALLRRLPLLTASNRSDRFELCKLRTHLVVARLAVEQLLLQSALHTLHMHHEHRDGNDSSKRSDGRDGNAEECKSLDFADFSMPLLTVC